MNAAVEVMVPLTRRRFVFADVGELHRAAPIGGGLFIGPEVVF